MAHKESHTHTHMDEDHAGSGDRDGSDAAVSPETPRTAGSHQSQKMQVSHVP